jgi:hypothetical protein
MQGAIGKLEKGDVECRIRAALLSRALNRWFVEWDLLEEANMEGLRTRRIEDTIRARHVHDAFVRGTEKHALSRFGTTGREMSLARAASPLSRLDSVKDVEHGRPPSDGSLQRNG